jgi:hypothetical protein
MTKKKSASPALTRLSCLIKDASEILSVEPKIIYDALAEAGIDESEEGVKLLNSPIITEEDLTDALSDIKAPKLKMKAAVSTLKGYNPYREEGTCSTPKDNVDQESKYEKELSPWGRQLLYSHNKRMKMQGSGLAESIAEGLKEVMPNIKTDFKQLKDKDLLELYIEDMDYEIEQELHRRAKHQPFIVLDPDKKINVEASIDLLKRARKMVNPSMVPVGDTVVPVYRITEVNPDDNIIELCPICGEVLYKGYCDKCELNFAGVGDDERAYVNLISKISYFNANSFSDRKAVIASATKGLLDLRKTWPGASKQFDELKLTNNLPSLRKIRALPSAKPADPFNVK